MKQRSLRLWAAGALAANGVRLMPSTFLAQAMKDPNSAANIDTRTCKINPAQGAGKLKIARKDPDLSRTDCGKDVLHEKVCNVAWSGKRKPGRGGKLPTVGNTVKGADYSNSIGAAILSAYWQDPNFKAGARAFYYARLLEIPTPSWIAYDMATFKIAKSAPNAVLVQKERAYSSPIWYSSKG